MKCSWVHVNLKRLAQVASGASNAEQGAHSAQTESEQMLGRSIGNEEVDSSILSRSTSKLNDLAPEKEVLRGSREPRASR